MFLADSRVLEIVGGSPRRGHRLHHYPRYLLITNSGHVFLQLIRDSQIHTSAIVRTLRLALNALEVKSMMTELMCRYIPSTTRSPKLYRPPEL